MDKLDKNPPKQHLEAKMRKIIILHFFYTFAC